MVWLFLSVLLVVVVYLAIQFPAFRAMLLIVIVAGAGGLYYIKVESDKSNVEYEKRRELSRRLDADREEQQRILDAEAERRRTQQALAEQQRRQQALAEQQRRTQQAALELAQRRQTASRYIEIVSHSIECPYSAGVGCGTYSFTVGLRNRSRETISRVSVGWVFLPQGQSGCPTSYPTRYQQTITLRPGDTTVLNIDMRFDGPKGETRYCVGLTGIDIVP
jgi:hypothetical protein